MESGSKQQNRCKQKMNVMDKKEGVVLQVAIVWYTKCGKRLSWRRYLIIPDRIVKDRMSVINVTASNEDRDFAWNFALRLTARGNSVTHRPSSKENTEHILYLVCLCEFVGERCDYLRISLGKPFCSAFTTRKIWIFALSRKRYMFIMKCN